MKWIKQHTIVRNKIHFLTRDCKNKVSFNFATINEAQGLEEKFIEHLKKYIFDQINMHNFVFAFMLSLWLVINIHTSQICMKIWFKQILLCINFTIC